MSGHAQGSTRTADGRVLTFCQWGPDDGYPVIVLHGTPGSRYLRHVQGEYDRQGVRAITYDRPGYGGSDRQPGRHVADAAEDIRRLADHLGLQRYALAGISGGGPPALAAAAADPGRVTRCGLIKASAPHDAEDLDPFDGMCEEDRAEWRCAEQGEECLAGPFYAESLAWVDELADAPGLSGAVRSMLVEAMREGLRSPWGMVDDYLSQLRPWGFDVADVHCETTVLIARDDTSVPPAHGRWLVQHLPLAEALMADGGHFGPQDEEEEELLGWLAMT